jgi:uncharacterized protein YcbX
MAMVQTGSLSAIYRYPVKGLSPQAMAGTSLRAGQTLPADRRYAIENGPSGFDPAEPTYLPKIRFLMLMRNERLATLQTHYDDASHVLTIRQDATVVASGDLETAAGRHEIEAFFAHAFARELRGPPRLLAAAGHSFSDVARKVVSIINLASVEELERLAGQPVDPLRFRGNLFVAGWPPWHEFTAIGATLGIGEARLKIVKRIVRCAAVDVDPATGLRDLELPPIIMRNYGHDDCGVYAEVIADGDIAVGDPVRFVSSTA